LTSGAVLTGYAQSLGATPVQLALIFGLPQLAQIGAPLAAWLALQSGHRRGVALATCGVGRAIWLLAPLLPLILPRDLQVEGLIALSAMAGVFLASNGALWAAWMGDVTPPPQRGRYFSLRFAILSAIGLAINITAGRYLDANAGLAAFQQVLVVAIAMGLVAVVLLALHWHPVPERDPFPLLKSVIAPYRNVAFRRLLAFNGTFTAAVWIAAPLVNAYFLQVIELSFTVIALLGVVSTAAAVVMGPVWGRLMDHFGNRPVMRVAVIGAAGLPALWVLATPAFTAPVWIAAALDGLAWSAVNIANFNLALHLTPGPTRAVSLATLGLVNGTAAFLGGLLGGAVAIGLAGPAQAAGLTGLHAVMVVSAVMRLAATFLLGRVEESGSATTAQFLREIGAWARRSLSQAGQTRPGEGPGPRP
jgi:MFS family permease